MRKKLTIILCAAAAVLLVIAGLVYIPHTQSLRYDMQGFLVNGDGKVVEQFPLTLKGKSYDFIIDRPGGGVSTQGKTVTRVTRDAVVLEVIWDETAITPQYTFGHFVSSRYRGNENGISGSYVHYNSIKNQMGSEGAMLDLEEQIFCMHADSLLDGAFIVGLADSHSDPATVIENFLRSQT